MNNFLAYNFNKQLRKIGKTENKMLKLCKKHKQTASVFQTVLNIKPGFHYTANATTTTQKQSDHKVEQSFFTLIALFSLEIGRCRGRNWPNGNQA